MGCLVISLVKYKLCNCKHYCVQIDLDFIYFLAQVVEEEKKNNLNSILCHLNIFLSSEESILVLNFYFLIYLIMKNSFML